MKPFILISLFLFPLAGFSQSNLPTPRNIQKTYEKATRSITGNPGKNYWQNRAEYKITVEFNPDTRLINGDEDIDYFNNSPDTLREILFKLYPNLYKKESIRLVSVDASDLTDGMQIHSLNINGGPNDTGKIRINGTNMRLLRTMLLPHQSIRISTKFSYVLNKTSHYRTGEIDSGADFVAYFFPRIAVYDDIDGWNNYSYNGRQEFYNDFCNFQVSIKVPSDQEVWATGLLLNANDVLDPDIKKRLDKSEKEDGIITIIDSTEMNRATNRKNPFNTWIFMADSVSDFVFACSNHYMWQSTSLVVNKSSGRRTRVDAVFNPRHKDYLRVINDARKTVEAMSYQFPAWPYPYPHETVFDGLDQMDYPMMVNDNPVEDKAESIELTDHEIFHTMFPFYMGINETKYAWMDEGWATIGEWVISPIIDSSLVDEYAIEAYSSNSGFESDIPIISPSTETSASYFTNSYGKPAMGYLYVKDMLGESLFTKALHHYIELWRGKHPMPNDFFYSMNVGAGRNLNWFWKNWFFDDGYPDLAVGSVKRMGMGYAINVLRKGGKYVPVDIKVEYVDGSTEKLHRSVAVWEKAASSVSINIVTSKLIKRLTIVDPHVPDANRLDNVYKMK